VEKEGAANIRDNAHLERGEGAQCERNTEARD
jgi:hypothetical protein